MDNLPVNWFDGALLILLVFGLFRGRKNGMTKEILPTIEWVCVVAAAAFTYNLVAQFYHGTCGLSELWSATLGYLSVAIVVLFIFSLIKKALMPRLTGSNIFGSAEYYLGMPSGMIRYACIALFFLALANARHYTAAEIAAKKAYNERWYGGGMYSGDYVPDFHSVQDAVFKKSFTGPYIQTYLAVLLVQTTPDSSAPQAAQKKQAQPVIHIGN
jgi:uncharacterized membrane protein required for colicin V production